MKRVVTFAFLSLLFPGLALTVDDAVGQQSGPARHKYFFRASLTLEGLKNLQKQSVTALRAGVAKFDESVGCKLETWYFDYTEVTAYGFADCPDEITAATLQLASNTAGFAHVVYRPVLSAEDADKALMKANSTRPPQQQ